MSHLIYLVCLVFLRKFDEETYFFLFPLQPNDLEYVNSEYGKNGVRLLYIRREGKIHYIKELEISLHIRLNNVNEYVNSDNSCVIPTDTIKNTIQAFAKCQGVCFYVMMFDPVSTFSLWVNVFSVN